MTSDQARAHLELHGWRGVGRGSGVVEWVGVIRSGYEGLVFYYTRAESLQIGVVQASSNWAHQTMEYFARRNEEIDSMFISLSDVNAIKLAEFIIKEGL